MQLHHAWGHIFFLLPNEARAATEEFVREYNEDRPHESMAKMPPVEFAAQRAGVGPCPLGASLKSTWSFY
jgi:putative transposase